MTFETPVLFHCVPFIKKYLFWSSQHGRIFEVGKLKWDDWQTLWVSYCFVRLLFERVRCQMNLWIICTLVLMSSGRCLISFVHSGHFWVSIGKTSLVFGWWITFQWKVINILKIKLFVKSFQGVLCIDNKKLFCDIKRGKGQVTSWWQ